jgi:hypothetical protein
MDARRWKLSKTVYDYSNETAWDGPDLTDDETVEVIELEPILDLLEGLLPLPRGFPGEGLGDSDEAPILALLREHGRVTT